jgi:hypothetical protein
VIPSVIVRGFEQRERIDGMNDGIRTIGGGSSARRGWYRGVKLQRPVSPPLTPILVLRRAVQAAIRKNRRQLSAERANAEQ